jgi:uncharacterized membrane protein
MYEVPNSAQPPSVRNPTDQKKRGNHNAHNQQWRPAKPDSVLKGRQHPEADGTADKYRQPQSRGNMFYKRKHGLVFGVWFLVFGVLFLVFGVLFLVFGVLPSIRNIKQNRTKH